MGGPDPFAHLKDLGWRQIAEIDGQLERGEIDETAWHEAMARLAAWTRDGRGRRLDPAAG